MSSLDHWAHHRSWDHDEGTNHTHQPDQIPNVHANRGADAATSNDTGATMDIAITGSSGLIGSALKLHLAELGHTAIPVVRSDIDGIRWDPAGGTIDAEGFEGIDAVIHLAGEGIGERRWSDEQKARIRDSRIDGTRLLATALAGLQKPPTVLLSGSAIGFYGPRGDEVLTEQSSRGEGFLSDVVVDWEAEAQPAVDAGIRTAFLRTGIVLSPGGGALQKMLPLFKFGLGGRMGKGDQWWSCISIDDVVHMMGWLLASEVSGPVNLTCPEPTTNADFTKTLGSVLGRPTLFPVPKFGPKLVVGPELAENLLFTSQRVEPAVALDAGYDFQHPTLEAALRGVLGKAD